MPADTKPKAVRNLRAPVADAITKLGADYDISPEFRAYLVAKVEKCGFGGVIVDAHEATSNGETHVHASVTMLYPK